MLGGVSAGVGAGCYVLPGAAYALGTEWALLVGRFWRAARCRGLQSHSLYYKVV